MKQEGVTGTRPGTTAELMPDRPTLRTLSEAAAGCQACDLWKTGTQTVFGEGPSGAELMVVGEQPGDQEDLSGRPFVGPAGRLLDQALIDAGIDRSKAYLTNAVKHFKWEPRGKRRIHAKPSWSEVAVCRPWLDAEIELLHPRVIVCLGATAAQTLLGKQFRVSRQRGELVSSPLAQFVTATIHPSAILRTRGEDRDLRRGELVADLRKVAALLKKPAAE